MLISSNIKSFGELSKYIVKKNVIFRSGKSRKEYTNLNNAINRVISTNRFDDVNILFSDFDWLNGYDDRNWWWEVQALPFLNWFVNSYELMSEDERKTSILFVKKSLLNWMDKESIKNYNSPLIWHDHASSFRLRNIVNWINFLVINNLYLDLVTPYEQLLILQMVDKHLFFLEEDKNYSKFTNHGFDQMMIVYEISLMWSKNSILNKIGNLAKCRLQEEFDYAFTDEGVHVENSPHYQKGMISRVKSLISYKNIGDNEISGNAQQLLEKTNKFLNVITMPNGYLPLIGDTVNKTIGINDIPSHVKYYDYSKSGYYIAKGLAKNGKVIHLIFKCSHISRYHRHDDDLSIHLYYDNEVIFGDGGLGFYQEIEQKRKFLRSPAAHNTIYPIGISAVRDPELLQHKPTMKVLEPGLVLATTSMYGGVLQRIIDIRNINNKEIIVKDKWLEMPSQDTMLCMINFFIPKKIDAKKLSNKHISFDIGDENINIIINDDKSVMYSDRTIISNTFAKFDEATKIGWQSNFSIGESKSINIEISDDMFQLDTSDESLAIRSSNELLNNMSIKELTLNLHRSVILDGKQILLKTETTESIDYAFYLYYGDNLEKSFYEPNSERVFIVPIDPKIIYKAVYYYKNQCNEKCSYGIKFQISDNNIKLFNSVGDIC